MNVSLYSSIGFFFWFVLSCAVIGPGEGYPDFSRPLLGFAQHSVSWHGASSRGCGGCRFTRDGGLNSGDRRGTRCRLGDRELHAAIGGAARRHDKFYELRRGDARAEFSGVQLLPDILSGSAIEFRPAMGMVGPNVFESVHGDGWRELHSREATGRRVRLVQALLRHVLKPSESFELRRGGWLWINAGGLQSFGCGGNVNGINRVDDDGGLSFLAFSVRDFRTVLRADRSLHCGRARAAASSAAAMRAECS